MRAKREAPKSRSSDRRRRADSPAAATRRTTTNSAPSRRIRSRAGKTSAPGRQARVSRPGPQTSPMLSPFDRPAPAKNTSQAKARAKARKAKAPKLVRPTPMERLAARLTSIDLRPRTLANKVPFVVLRYRFARRRTRPHTVVVHRCRREVLPAEQRPGADPDAAAAQGSAGTRRTRGCVGAGAGRGGSSPGHDPDEGYRPPGSGSGRQLGGGRYTQAG